MVRRLNERLNLNISPIEGSKETRFFLRCILVFTIFLFMTGCGNLPAAESTESTSSEEQTESIIENTTSSSTLPVDAIETNTQQRDASEAYNTWLSGVPENYQDTWTSHGLTYEWDASVIVPEIETFPIYQKKAISLSQNTVDRVISVLSDSRMPVSFKDYISYTAYRADLESVFSVSDGIARIWEYRIKYGQYSYMDTDLESLQYTLDNSSEKIKHYQYDYLKMNESNIPIWNSEDAKIHTVYESYSDFGKYEDVDGIVMAFPNDAGFYDLLAITNQVGEYAFSQYYIQYLSYNQGKVQTGLLEEECELTRNQAICKADEIIGKFGIENLVPGQVQYLAGYYTVYFKSTEEPLDYPENLAKCLPMPLSMDKEGKRAEHELTLMGYYDAYITLGKDHIREICLPISSHESIHVTEMSYADMLTFSEMMEGYQSNFERIAEYMEDTGMLSNAGSHITVHEIRLLNMYVFDGWFIEGSDASAVYESIPVWCFFGRIETGLDQSEKIMWSRQLDISDANILIGTVRAVREPGDTRFAGENRDIPYYTSEYSQDVIILGRYNYLVEDDALAHIIAD